MDINVNVENEKSAIVEMVIKHKVVNIKCDCCSDRCEHLNKEEDFCNLFQDSLSYLTTDAGDIHYNRLQECEEAE